MTKYALKFWSNRNYAKGLQFVKPSMRKKRTDETIFL